jgi:hypothetical protein
MSEVAIDLEAERRASMERRNAKMRPSRARMVRAQAAEYGGIQEAAEAIFGHLGEEEVGRIAALAASDDPLDDGSRRLTPAEIEAIMQPRRLNPEQRERLREFVAAARQADPNARASDVRRRAQEDLGIEIGAENFRVTYWQRAAGGAPKTNGRPKRAKSAAAPKAKKRAQKKSAKPHERAAAPTARKSVVPLDALIERLEPELRVIEERAVEIRAAIKTIRELEPETGGAR